MYRVKKSDSPQPWIEKNLQYQRENKDIPDTTKPHLG